jgi:unsaturated rhamnogalacturonyl hydrolase
MNRLEKIKSVKQAMLAMRRDAWEQGVAAQAFLELGEHKWVYWLARDSVVQQGPDGRLGLTYGNKAATDPAANGEPVLAAARDSGEKWLADAAARMTEFLLKNSPKTDDGVICHVLDTKQVWIDSMYMCPPYLAVAGYPEEAVKQVEGYRRLMRDPEKKLYSHMWDDEKKVFLRKDFWGVGNGWTATGITRVIKHLPEPMAKEKATLIGYVQELLDTLLGYLRPDGFFHDVVDNPATFVETNLSQMLSYSIYRGVKAGYLDKAYLKHADAMRKAVYGKVDEHGLVHDVCGAPLFNSPGTATEGQAFFLLMEAAHQDM